ncbi:hypothetical protein [Burkholderia cenocepacia]|nr:hypothetical protein [Burkholderia cenocepacia]
MAATSFFHGITTTIVDSGPRTIAVGLSGERWTHSAERPVPLVACSACSS